MGGPGQGGGKGDRMGGGVCGAGSTIRGESDLEGVDVHQRPWVCSLARRGADVTRGDPGMAAGQDGDGGKRVLGVTGRGEAVSGARSEQAT